MSDNSVFISYARQDRKWAQWLEERLGKQGFRILTDLTVPTGQAFIAELNRMIEGSDLVVALLSPAYFRSEWRQLETAAAAASRVPIIPVLVEPCEVEGFLRYYHFADVTSDRDKGLREVIEAAEHLLAQSAV